MGRFASHLKLVSEQTRPCSFTSLPYIFVDYTRLTTLVNECLSHTPENGDTSNSFCEAWDEELARSTSNFDKHYMAVSQVMIDAIIDSDDCGNDDDDDDILDSPDPRVAVEIIMKVKGRDFVLNLLQEYKTLLQTASLNSEALQLVLKKYDKRAAEATAHKQNGIKKSSVLRQLLPKLYASTAYHATGARSLMGEVQVVRDFLEENGDDDGANAAAKPVSRSSSSVTEEAEALREEEFKWFTENAKGLDEKELAALVAHRGFHCEEDDSVTRPIENSLSSFEYAWGAGVHLCECDVGVTKDEKIIMAHDEDFARLALLSHVKEANTVVKDLTLADIMRMPLKHGSRPPLLVDVLRSAMAIGEHAKLVIEIKPGNSEIVDPLMMLFSRHPTLLSRVAVIMSFDTYVIQDIADRFAISNMSSVSGTLGAIAEGKIVVNPGSGVRPTRHLRKTMTRAMQSVSYGVARGSVASGTIASVPKLLVLTAYIDYGPDYLVTSVKDGFQMVTDKLPAGNGIDGVYVEYEPEMFEPEGKAKMLKLAESYTVGVWMLKPRDPDALSVAKRLVEECGVSYVNTDFHRDFFSS